MLDLREVGVRVAVIDQRVEIFRRFPNAFLAPRQAEVLLLFTEHVVNRLLLVIQSVKFRHAGVGVRVILAEFGFGLALLVSTLEEVLPLIQIRKWVLSSWKRCAHTLVVLGWALTASVGLHVSARQEDL